MSYIAPMESAAYYRVPPPAEWPTEDAQAQNRMLRAAVTGLIIRTEKAEAQVKEHPADLAGLINQIQLRDKEAAELAFELAELAHELTYERQMRQQMEEAVGKMARRVTEQQAELAEQERDKLALLQEVQALRNANFRLEKEADKNYTGYRFS